MRSLFLIVSIIVILIGCSKEDVPTLQSIIFQEENIELTIGENYQCKLDIYPSKSEYPKCRWSSSNEDVVSVSFDGVVKANSVGYSTINAYVNDDISTSCIIKVLPKHVQSVALDKKLIEAYTGDEVTLSCSVMPVDATYKDVYWYSTNDDVAKVDKNGIVYCKREGIVDIIAGTTEMDGYTKSKRDTCHLTVSFKKKRFLYKFDLWDNDCPYELEFGDRNNIWATTNKREVWLGIDSSVSKTDKLKRNGFAAEIKTLDTNELSKMIGIHIVPGVLFMGKYSNVSDDKLSWLTFGSTLNEKPLSIKGWYNYKSGTGDYINSDGSVNVSEKDKCGIYAVYHGVDRYSPILCAKNIFSAKEVIAIAKFQGGDTKENEMYPFEASFVNTGNAGSFFSEYRISIVLVSSSEGLNYEGVIGSTLIVDDLEVVVE